jgi:hypothetical protein
MFSCQVAEKNYSKSSSGYNQILLIENYFYDENINLADSKKSFGESKNPEQHFQDVTVH